MRQMPSSTKLTQMAARWICVAVLTILASMICADGRNIKSSATATPGSHGKTTKQSPYSAKSADIGTAATRFNITLEKSEWLSDEDANVLLAKNSYCMCECCRPKIQGPNTCRAMVRINLPDDFKCPANFCQQALRNSCAKWNKNRCEKACFCQKCKHKLEAGDTRCSGELDSAANCQCRGHESSTSNNICVKPTQGIAKVWLSLMRAKKNKKFIKCTMACFCRNCNHTTLATVFEGLDMTGMCKAHPQIPNYCSTTCPACPDREAASQAKQVLQQIQILEGTHG